MAPAASHGRHHIRKEPDMSDTDDWSDTYGTQVLDVIAPWGLSQHLKVSRHDGRDGIPWEDLQRIKDDLLGMDVTAVEIYPPQHLVVNEANMRHLWTVPPGYLDGIGFGEGL